MLVHAATGCGKTSCFCMAALAALTPGVAGPQVVVLVPNRPLAEEVHRVTEKLGSEVTFDGRKGVPIAAAYGAFVAASRCLCAGRHRQWHVVVLSRLYRTPRWRSACLLA
jgi:superfamily II DNA/RNA helicase